MPEAVGYDLVVAQSIVVLAHGKCLVKTALYLAMTPGCHGRIDPRSGLTLKKFINMCAEVLDRDRGEVGVILFNFGNKIIYSEYVG